MGFWPIKRWILGKEVGATLITTPATDNGMKGKNHAGMSVAGFIKETPYAVRTAKGQGNWELAAYQAPRDLEAVDLAVIGIPRILEDLETNPDHEALFYVAKLLGKGSYEEILKQVGRALMDAKTHIQVSSELRDWVMHRWLDLEGADYKEDSEEVEGG